MKTRILLLTQWFDPEPTFKGLVFARELIRQGFEVEVVTGFPNYPGGNVYAGYSIKVLQREFIDGVHITRLPLYPNHGHSAIKRAMNYASFGASAFIYCLFFAKRPDVVYAYHPPLTVGIVASLIRIFRGIPIVYDIQDMWPDTLRATGMVNGPRLLNLVAKVCNWVYRRVDQIVVLSPGFKRLLIERGVSENKIEIIYNWADEISLGTPTRGMPNKFSVDGRFKIVFAGNIGKAQALDVVIDAAILLGQTAPQVVFIMIGDGIELPRLKQRVVDLKLQNVVFLPSVPMTEIGDVLSSADALLVHLKVDPLFRITIPSKTQAYMFMGKPLLMAVDGDAAKLVAESGGGIVTQSDSPQQLADAVIELAELDEPRLRGMGMSANSYYQKNLSLRVGVTKFANLFEKIK